MRAARIADLRRALERRTHQAPSIKEIKFENLPGFANSEVRPASGFLSICGGTGLGKTALLELLRLALEPRTAGHYGQLRDRLHNAVVRVAVTYPGGIYDRQTAAGMAAPADEEGYPPGVQFVGLADRTSDLQLYFDGLDVDIAKDGVDPIVLSEQEISLVSSICRKSYKSAKIFEVDYEGDLFIPFFEITDDDASYDTRTMATGELSAFYMLWSLKRAEPYSIVLIEEPEAYLPPLSHSAMFGLLCDYTISGRLGVVITTHSALIASEIPDKCLMPVRRQSGASILPVGAESKARVLSRLGLGPRKSAVLFVEDDLARIVLRELISLHELELVCSLEINVPGAGFGDVKRALEGVPTSLASIRFLGVLDGDMRDRVEDWPSLASISFLPFARSMEVELLEAAGRTPMKFASAVHRPAARVTDVLEGTKGLDHHDRWNTVAADLGLTADSLVPATLERWLKTRGNKSMTQSFVRDLAANLGVSLP